MSSGTGRRMISLKNGSLRRILLSQSPALIGPVRVPPEFGAVGDQRVHGGFAVLASS